ncbi:N-formylglutamate amidohydrolase [Qipengyuania sp. MTN3-11]
MAWDGQEGVIPGSDEPAFRFSRLDEPALPVLIAVPHAGRVYPSQLRERMRQPGWSSLRLEDRYVDALARKIATATGAALLVANAPRAMIDLNRARDDLDWSMIAGGAGARQPDSIANRRARSGLGLVPRRLPGLGEIWKDRIGREELTARIESVHRPYHRRLGRTLENIRDVWGAALLIDLHSMPPLKSGAGCGKPAEFVIGDRFGASCDAVLSARAIDHIGKAGRQVAHNRPYSGGYVLDTHAAPSRGIHALQIEICRSTYLDARLDVPGPRLPTIARLLTGMIQTLAEDVARMGSGDALAFAAE